MIELLLLIGLVVFITHSLEAVTGFGCTVMAFPFVIALMGDLERAKIVLSILAWVLALYFAITQFKQIHWKQFGIIALLAGLGMPAGMALFQYIDSNTLKKILGIFIVVSAAIQLYKSFILSKQKESIWKKSGYLFLLVGGVVHGAFAVGGPLVVLYSTRTIPNKGQFRATMCLLWTSLNTILMIQYLFQKQLTLSIGRDVLFLLPFLIAGIFAGEAIHNRINEKLFKKIVFLSLLIVGVIMVFYS